MLVFATNDAKAYADNCPQSAIVLGGRNLYYTPNIYRKSLSVVDIMELPVTSKGNRYVIVFQICLLNGTLLRTKTLNALFS